MNDNKVARSNGISPKKTIATLVVFGMIIAFPLAITDKLAFAIGTNTTSGTAGASMMKLTTTSAPVVIPLVKALYDSKGVLFIITEVSDKAMRDQIGNFTGSLVNYEPNLTKSQDIGQLWIFKNGVKGPGLMGFQTNVLNSIPGDPHYTPLWKVNIVEWKTTSTPTILGSDDIIANAVKKGQITVTPTNVVINCPVVQWGGNKDNTIPAGHI
ncbi:MAG: hypothetical protein M3P08_13950 [Thermoproteota archaeon]|nr:hypothetical protein [Thermoproteota archaeon]